MTAVEFEDQRFRRSSFELSTKLGRLLGYRVGDRQHPHFGSEYLHKGRTCPLRSLRRRRFPIATPRAWTACSRVRLWNSPPPTLPNLLSGCSPSTNPVSAQPQR